MPAGQRIEGGGGRGGPGDPCYSSPVAFHHPLRLCQDWRFKNREVGTFSVSRIQPRDPMAQTRRTESRVNDLSVRPFSPPPSPSPPLLTVLPGCSSLPVFTPPLRQKGESPDSGSGKLFSRWFCGASLLLATGEASPCCLAVPSSQNRVRKRMAEVLGRGVGLLCLHPTLKKLC